MNQRSLIKQITLYRYRYIIGGLLLVGLLIGLLTTRLNLAPIGLSTAVADSVVISANLSLDKALQSSLIDLPYHILQQLSIDSFGTHKWSITLPSTVVAVLTGIIFTLMIRRWFRPNIAVITGLIFVTSAPFLTIGRSGLPTIMLLFWLSLILLAATNILHSSKRSQLWQFVGIVAVGLSLYTPLMVYPLIALSVAGLLHPHVRYVFKKINPYQKAIGAFVFLIIIAPLIVSLIVGSTDVRQLIGMAPGGITIDTIIDNIIFTVKTSLGFHLAIIGDLPKPFFVAPVIILATLGLIKTIIDNYAARSYMLILWLILLIAPLMLQPSNLYATLIPVFLLVAIGVEVIVREWYKLFPLNPYARIVGLVPLSAMLLIVMLSGPFQYFYGHYYATSNTEYHQALEPTRKILDARDQSTTLVTSPRLKSFYDIVSREYPKLTVTDKLSKGNPSGQIIVHKESGLKPDLKTEKIITTDNSTNYELLTVYSVN